MTSPRRRSFRPLRGLGLRGLVAAVAVTAASAATTAITAATAAESSSNVIAVTGARVHIGDGDVLESATVLCVDGRITAVGPGLSIPDDAVVVDVDGAELTPGLIDANARLESRDLVTTEVSRRQGAPLAALFAGHDHALAVPCTCSGLAACSFAAVHEELEDEMLCPICGYPGPPGIHELISGVRGGGATPTETSSEIVPHTWMIDALNLRSPDFERLVREGVTTVYASPDNAAVIGPRGAIVRTAGSMRERVVLEAADVHAAMGPDTYSVGGRNGTPFRNFVSVNTRRPGSRMGVAWVFRKAMYDARKFADGVEPGGADTAPTDAFPVLNDILDGDQSLRIAARTQRDIEAALRLADEFDLDFMLTEATEAHGVLDALRDTETPVVFGPIITQRRGFRGEQEAKWTTFRDLLEAGIPTALSARDLREEDGLARQAMYAMRSGVSLQDALRAVTLTPAELLGVADDAGSLTVGKRADIVVWSGEPFAATSRPVAVIVDGDIVVDRRDD